MEVSQAKMTRELTLSPHSSFTLPPPPPPLHDDHAISRIVAALPCVYPRRGFRRGPRGFCCNQARTHGGGRRAVPVYWRIYPHGTSQERAGGRAFINVHAVPTSPFCGLIDYLHCSPIVTDPGVCFSFLTRTCTTHASLHLQAAARSYFCPRVIRPLKAKCQ